MSDLVGNPEDRFSHNEAHLHPHLRRPLSAKCLLSDEVDCELKEADDRGRLLQHEAKTRSYEECTRGCYFNS